MGIKYTSKTARLFEVVTVEEAEGLHAWLQSHPKGRINLADCSHLHTANLQILMAMGPSVSAWPKDERLAVWLRDAMREMA